MTPWIITLSSGQEVASSTVLTAHVSAVIGLAGGNPTWAEVDPTESVMALIAWLTVLEAQGSGRDPAAVMQEILAIPMIDLKSRIRTQ